MNAAVYPEAVSEDLKDALALADLTASAAGDLDIDNGTLRDADILVVELGHGAIRQLREVSRIEETYGIPVVLVAAVEHLALIDSSDTVAEFVTTPLDPVEFRIRVRRLVR
ncbi:MAG TPA: hypothetical protein VF115_15590, partial [Acidimicrobiia bacterium]